MFPNRLSLFVGLCACLCLFVGAALHAAEPTAPATVGQIKVVNDKAPDCTTLKTIVESVTRGCKTNDDKAIALYNFMRLTHYHRAYPSEPTDIPVLKEINCYGWSLCGGLHAEQSALWRELGWDWRFVGWPGHTTVEAFYDGRWHYLDVFLKFYTWMPDPNHPGQRTIAGQDDILANPKELLFDSFVLDQGRKVAYAKGNEFEMIGNKANWQAPAFLVCGDDIPGIADGIRHKNRAGSPTGWAGMTHASGNYSAAVNLAPCFALTNTWDHIADAWYWRDSKLAPCHTCGDKEIRNSPEKGPVAEPYLGPDWKCESYANGTLSFHPDFGNAVCLRSFAAIENVKATVGGLVPTEAGKPARVSVLLQSPYILTQGRANAEGVEKCEISIDDGKSWKPADPKNFSAEVKGQLQALVRFTFSECLKKLDIEATVQNNPFALPFLVPGRNTITVSVADPAALGDNKLVVTYAYRPGERDKSYEQLCLEGKEIARGHAATWSTTPVVVQKVFSARDLPATFDIDVATPKGKHPVYPRMLFVRREVVAPGQKPLPLPENAQSPPSGPMYELKTLPNPLLVGTQAPPAKKVRPVKTLTIELTGQGTVSRSGEPAGDLLRWPKNDKEKVDAVAYLVGGKLEGLPPLEDLAAARLVFPAMRAHQKAPTRIGVALLKATKEGQALDFSRLGEVVGSTVVPVQPEGSPEWSPPKEFKIDVSRTVRSLILGDGKFQGFALRVVPDRGIDDGWTVRVQLPKQPKIVLEVDVFQSPAAK
jgi:hypothetical protein